MKKILKRIKTITGILSEYFSRRGEFATRQIGDGDALCGFLETRSSHVAQTALYGYIRTRAGSRFPELFENDALIEAINIAKWQMWVACLSDLSVYAGRQIRRESEAGPETVDHIMARVVARVLDRTGIPEDAGDRFSESADLLVARLRETNWEEGDDEAAFAVSPDALVYWAPIVDELKELDSEIVRNSVRFRWHEVRRELRQSLDAQGILADMRTV